VSGGTGLAHRHATGEPAWLQRLLLAAALAFLTVFLVLPLAVIFRQALGSGVGAYLRALVAPEARAALGLSLLVAAIVVPLNTVFGLAAAWALGKFSFRGKAALVTLFDLPFAVSPVVAGLLFVLLFGRDGLLAPLAAAGGIRVLFALPGIVLATLFVTVPFVARELIPLMQAQGREEEEAARMLGASGWRTFRRVTLPNVRWALLYGVVLTTARSLGEFGAVSVVSGHIRGETTTLPLEVEMLHAEFRGQEAFAVASLLTLVAVASLVAKHVLERRAPRLAGNARGGPA
jgi:sulfate transport system permease protein